MSAPNAGREPEPNGYLVLVDQVTRIHFLDWGAPAGTPDGTPDGTAGTPDGTPAILLIHGLAGTAWAWAPVARRLARDRRVVAMDLRGHGLSDAPTDGYALDGLAGDALAVAEGSGFLDGGGAGVVVAGHGFGAMVAAGLARALGDRCAGLVLVDGGWEDPAAAMGLEPGELLRSLEEPPEMLRSMAAYLADRAGFDPATWDADQERAARAAVVELPVGRVVPVTRPHVLAACVDAMFGYRPAIVLAGVAAPIGALVAAEDEQGGRRPALAALQSELSAAGRPQIFVVDLPADGHNLMRYRPESVVGAIAAVDGRDRAYHPGS